MSLNDSPRVIARNRVRVPPTWLAEGLRHVRTGLESTTESSGDNNSPPSKKQSKVILNGRARAERKLLSVQRARQGIVIAAASPNKNFHHLAIKTTRDRT